VSPPSRRRAPVHVPARNDNLSIHEDKSRGVYVKGLTEVYVGSEAEVYKVLKVGGANRATSSTSMFIIQREVSLLSFQDMNAESSRSHSIFVIGIHQRNTESGGQKSGNLYLVDLAGSEKVCFPRLKRTTKLTR
jgi:kinesin family protein 5